MRGSCCCWMHMFKASWPLRPRASDWFGCVPSTAYICDISPFKAAVIALGEDVKSHAKCSRKNRFKPKKICLRFAILKFQRWTREKKYSLSYLSNSKSASFVFYLCILKLQCIDDGSISPSILNARPFHNRLSFKISTTTLHWSLLHYHWREFIFRWVICVLFVNYNFGFFLTDLFDMTRVLERWVVVHCKSPMSTHSSKRAMTLLFL